MNKASIYTVNNGESVAFQFGKSRVLVNKQGKQTSEVKENNLWRAAKNYLNPNFVEKVKAAITN